MLLLGTIEITGDNDTFTFYDGSAGGGSDKSITLDAGVYLPYRTEFDTDYPSLYDEIETKINASASGTYHLECSDPVLSSGWTNAGIKIVRDSGADQWGLKTDSGNFDYRIFGFNEDSGDQLTSGGHTELAGDYTRYGVWQTPDECAGTRVMGHKMYDQTHNGAARANAVIRRWGSDEIRLLEWYHVPGAVVRPRINEDSDYADVASLAQHDHGNYWADFWDHSISTYRNIIRLPDVPSDLRVETHAFEILASHRDSEYAAESDSTFSLTDESALFYDLEVGFARVTGLESTYSNYIRLI